MNKKYALCVGLNYEGTPNRLSGCINDAHDWRDLLASAGYEVVVLTDGAGSAGPATRDGIMAVLEEAVGKLGWGDRLVFTYSGHGTWVPDGDGDELDRRDEALCPSDFVQGRLITDDLLQRTFSRARIGAGMLVLSDSCHSGTVSRFTGVVRPGLPRFVSPAAFTDLTPTRAAELEREVSAVSPRRTASLISGCDDPEYSYDAWFGGRANGAFSRVAIDTYKHGATLASWHRAIRSRLPNDVYDQTPQISATTYRRYSRAL